MQSEVVWSALQWPAVERVAFSTDDGESAPGRWAADGAMVGVIDGLPTHLVYRLVVGGDGATRGLDLSETAGGRSLSLRGDGHGHWRDATGAYITALDGCIDVDISTTPLTNTLPIRRLRLAPGDSATVTAVYVDVPALTAKPADQRYTRLDESTYRYESGSFAADVIVDADDLVIDYAALWRRIETMPRTRS